MKKFSVLLGKSALALLSVALTLMLYAEGWAIWYAEYHIGLPTETQLAALPTTGHLCSAESKSAYIALADMPLLLRQTVVAVEEPDFLTRPNLLLPATLADIAQRKSQRPRGSSITFRVNGNCLRSLSPECCRGFDWHVGSLVFMGRIERVFSRDRILESYLNDSYLGRGTDGVAAGATGYFGKTLKELDIDEIAFLVAHLRMPYPGGHAKERRDFVVDRMRAAGLIDEAQATAAKATQLPWLDNQPRDL